MTIQRLAKQLNISADRLERESVRAYLLSTLGAIEARRMGILKTYTIESTGHWDEQLESGVQKEGGYTELQDYFLLDRLEQEKEDIIKTLLTHS